MIVTVTPNPSLDRTLEVERLTRGEVLRARDRRVEPGGKGINVARTLHAHGIEVRAVLLCGGFEGDRLVALLREAGVAPVVIRVAEPVRANVALVEPDGTVTKINEPGPVLSSGEQEGLLAATAAAAAGATWVVVSGSLAPGTPPSLFADLVRRGRAAGARVAVDTSGPAFAAALDARPDLVKPNLDELREVTGLPITTVGDAVEAAGRLRRRGAGTVLASLGAAGALVVDAHGVLHAHCPVAAPRSSVGAGDAMLAGYLAAEGAGRVAALRTAVAFGAAAVTLPGSQMPGPLDVRAELVLVSDLARPDLPLPPGPGPEPGGGAPLTDAGQLTTT